MTHKQELKTTLSIVYETNKPCESETTGSTSYEAWRQLLIKCLRAHELGYFSLCLLFLLRLGYLIRNLSDYSTWKTPTVEEYLSTLPPGQKAILYAATTQSCDCFSASLRAYQYHLKLDDHFGEFERWSKGNGSKSILACSGFNTGIDVPDVEPWMCRASITNTWIRFSLLAAHKDATATRMNPTRSSFSRNACSSSGNIAQISSGRVH